MEALAHSDWEELPSGNLLPDIALFLRKLDYLRSKLFLLKKSWAKH